MTSSSAETVNARPIPPLPRLILAPAADFRVPKVKLGTAIIGISSIHLLKTFIKGPDRSDSDHITFLLSAMAIAATDRIMFPADKMKPKDRRPNKH